MRKARAFVLAGAVALAAAVAIGYGVDTALEFAFGTTHVMDNVKEPAPLVNRTHMGDQLDAFICVAEGDGVVPIGPMSRREAEAEYKSLYIDADAKIRMDGCGRFNASPTTTFAERFATTR